jgi:hypothetical protein
MKIRPVEAELFRADGRTDMTKLTFAFRAKAQRPIQEPKTLLQNSFRKVVVRVDEELNYRSSLLFSVKKQ